VLQGDDPGDALALAAAFRGEGWTANVDLRGRNLSATRRSAQRQGYQALARRIDGKVETTRLSDDATFVHADVPSPDEVENQ
jgi:hypothetical protein